MEIGKLPNSVLQELIIDKLRAKRKEILLRPKIGEDCSAVDFGTYACVLTSDPITAASKEAGKLAVLVCCNDLASSGAEPVGLMITLLLPPESTKEELSDIINQIAEASEELNVDIIGGHTEVTAAVNKIVLTCTAVGIAEKGKLVSTSGARPGDGIILTKFAGLEGTAIIAADKDEELRGIIDDEILNEAKRYIENISVIKEGMLASAFGVSAMHDVTEGGVLGAVWEMCEASGTGAVIDYHKIPVSNATIKICEHYGIDPLKLISSGCMLIACRDCSRLAEQLVKNGVPAAVIGYMTYNTNKVLKKDGMDIVIGQPEADELYKLV